MQELVRYIFIIPMLLVSAFVTVRDKPQRIYTGTHIPVASPTGTWKNASSLPTQRYDFGGAVWDDKLYVVGGLVLSTPWAPTSRVDAYDPKINRWVRVADYPRAVHHEGVVSCSGNLYVVGGYWIRVITTNYVYMFDKKTNSWVRRADLPDTRAALGVSCGNGKIYAIGGEKDRKQQTSVYEYDTNADSWITKAPMPTAREHLSVVTVNGNIYALGGLSGDRFHLNTENEMFNPESNSWTTRAPLPHGISGFAAVALGDSIFIFGGANGDSVSPEVFEYKTTEDHWYRRSDLSEARYGFVSGVLDGKIHLVGGNSVVKGNFFTRNHEVFVP